MSVLRLPPAEPPEDARAAELRELVAFVTHQLAEAGDKLARVKEWADDPHLAGADRVHTRVLLAVRSHEVELWKAELEAWTQRLSAHNAGARQ